MDEVYDYTDDDLADTHSDTVYYTTESALWAYTGDEFYDELNYALRKDTDQLVEFKPLISALREALRNHHAGGTVYRGVNMTHREADLYKKGFQFLWPGFTSTSRDEWIADRFGSWGEGVKVIFEIKLDGKGPKGVTWSRDISEFSQYPEEEEVLIYCYSGFRVSQRWVEGDTIRVKLMTVDTLKVENSHAKTRKKPKKANKAVAPPKPKKAKKAVASGGAHKEARRKERGIPTGRADEPRKKKARVTSEAHAGMFRRFLRWIGLSR